MATKRFSIAGVVFNDDAPAEVVAKAEKPKKKAAAKAKAPKVEAETTAVVDQAAMEVPEGEGSDLV